MRSVGAGDAEDQAGGREHAVISAEDRRPQLTKTLDNMTLHMSSTIRHSMSSFDSAEFAAHGDLEPFLCAL